MTKRRLPSGDLETRHPGVTHAIAGVYWEAAKVCLDRHHTSPTELQLDDSGTTSEVVVEWEGVDDRTKRAWANDIDRTENGAYGMVIPAVEVARGLVAISRAQTGTGADYYVAQPSSHVDDLEEAIRLEVSGLDTGSAALVNERLRIKVLQLKTGKGNLPALAGVVGFKARLIALEQVDR